MGYFSKMTYYLLLDGDTEKEAYFSSNILGDESFGVFYPEQGMDVLMKLANNKSKVLEHIRIKDEVGKSYTLEDFISIIDKLKIKKAWHVYGFIRIFTYVKLENVIWLQLTLTIG